MQRREFISKAGFAVAAGAIVAACDDKRSENGDVRPKTSSVDSEWQNVRSQFDLSRDVIHMSALLVSTHPAPVRDAIDRFRRELNANPVTYVKAQNNRRKHEARSAAADYLRGRTDAIALTDSTTMGIALVYHGLALQPGDEILTTEHDYYATHESLRQVSDRTGASVRTMALFDVAADASVDQIVDRISNALTPSTRVLALTWVHSSTGLKLPMPQIAEAVADVNRGRSEEDRLLIGLDGVHGFGVEDIDIGELGCDFFMAGCHKWLFGPRGTGIVWAHEDAWARLRPVIPSFIEDASWNAWAEDTAPAGPTTAARMTPGGFKSFEHQWAMPDAFAFHQEIGKSRIAERTHALAGRLKDGLADMSHVTLHTPRDETLSAGIVCFEVDGLSPDGTVDALSKRGIIATTTPYAVSYPRLTPSIYNSMAEVDAAVDAIGELG